MSIRAALLSLLSLLAAAPLAAAAPASAQPLELSTRAVDVRIETMDVVVSDAEGDHLTMRGTLVNTTAGDMDRVRVLLLLGPALGSRGALLAPPDERQPNQRPDSETVWRSDQTSSGRADAPLVVDDLAPGARQAFSIDVPVADLGIKALTQTAVLPLRVAVTSFNRALVGATDTFLVWEPPASRIPLRLGWVVPVADVPHRDVFGRHIGEDLQGSVSRGGRLDSVLSTVEQAQGLAGNTGDDRLVVTLAVDADLVEAVEDMTRPYRVVRGGGEPEERRSSADAARWLERLRALAAVHPVIALPYADADVAAIAHSGLRGSAAGLVRRGRSRLGDLRLPAAGPAWPADGLADGATVSAFAAGGTDSVLLSGASLPVAGEINYTPTAVAPVAEAGRQLTALVTDPALSALAIGVDSAEGGRLVGQQRLLAEIAMLYAERPGIRRDAVIALPRLWSPVPDATAALLAQTATASWTITAGLPAIIKDGPRAGERMLAPRLTPLALSAELPPADVRRVASTGSRLAAFRALVTPTSNPKQTRAGKALTTRLTTARVGVSRALSIHWRGRPAGAQLLVTQVADELARLRGKLTVVFSEVTLTSTSGRVPVTVVNHLGTPVRLRLRVTSERLLTFGRIPDTVVPPGQHTIDIRFKAQSVGRFLVTAQLYNLDDARVTDPVTARVRTTAYGRAALAITGAAFGLLVLTVILRFLLRRRRGDPPAATAEAAPRPLVPVGGSHPS